MFPKHTASSERFARLAEQLDSPRGMTFDQLATAALDAAGHDADEALDWLRDGELEPVESAVAERRRRVRLAV
jgi:hypothetical protein